MRQGVVRAQREKATWPIGGLWVLLVHIHSGGSSSSNSGSGSGSGKVVMEVRI